MADSSRPGDPSSSADLSAPHRSGDRSLLAELAERALDRRPPTRDEALAVLALPDDDVLDVVGAAFRVRRRFFGRRVKMNFLVNVRSGLCPEDCSYCSQRKGSEADVLTYKLLDTGSVLDATARAAAAGATRVCLVGSGRGPSARDVRQLSETVRQLRSEHPQMEVCVSLGLLQDGQAAQLAEAGVFAYNHNLNTSESRYDDICSTHTYDDRVGTVGQAKVGGLSPCSGAIFGMGEGDEDIVDLALSLRELGPDSVPVNFLIPFDGTPMAGRRELTPERCLTILGLYRFFFPDTELRIAGGREIHLGALQPLGLYVANSIFIGDYLTSEGQPGEADRQMIAEAGFVVEGEEGPSRPRTELATPVALRRRGPGTEVAANA
jgi:biotin synthase